jgi:hypothetical protein
LIIKEGKMRNMRDTETLNRIERLANEFIWQNEWLGVLNVSKTTDGEIIKIHMGDDELYRLARLCGEPLLNDDGRDYFFDGPYMFFTLV